VQNERRREDERQKEKIVCRITEMRKIRHRMIEHEIQNERLR
jgi:hypothetical protein